MDGEYLDKWLLISIVIVFLKFTNIIVFTATYFYFMDIFPHTND